VDSFLGRHPGYSRIFSPGLLTVGLFLPLWPYDGDFRNMSGQGEIIVSADRSGFGALWLRDVPLQITPNADVGQVYDPWVYAGYLAAKTERITIATGSVITTLRHPIDLAKQAASIDQLSGGRLVLGIASGDRVQEFPAYGVDHESRGERFRTALGMIRALSEPDRGPAACSLGDPGETRLLPLPAFGRIPMLVTGRARQSDQWIAEQGDGWLTYPGPTTTAEGPKQLGENITRLRELREDGDFFPVTTNEWIDLVEDSSFPPIALAGGKIMRTGTRGLLDLLGRWQDAGVNHGALGVQLGSRPRAEVVQQLAEEVVPYFPAHAHCPPPAAPVW
jgi:luciferase-type oxidoreductase